MFAFYEFLSDLSSAKSTTEMTSLLKQHINETSLMWMIQKTIGVGNVFHLIPKNLDAFETTDLGKFGLNSPKALVEELIKERNTSFDPKRSISLYKSYIESDVATKAQKEMMKIIVSGDFFGMTASQINEVYGICIVPEFRNFGTTNFRKDFLDPESGYWQFKKENGGFISIVKFGDSVEIYSRQGKLYRIFDDIRVAFKNCPIDGVFQAQLYYLNEKGISDSKLFLSETAKKDQSINFKCDVFDYYPLTCLSGRSNGESFESRYGTAKMIIDSFVADGRISLSEMEDFNINKKPKDNYIVIDKTINFTKTKPKHFMLNEVKKK